MFMDIGRKPFSIAIIQSKKLRKYNLIAHIYEKIRDHILIDKFVFEYY